MVDLNATQAAIRAGYSENTASETGYENLRKPQIADRIAELRSEITQRNNITIDEVVGTIAKLARFDIADLYDEDGQMKNIHDIPEDARLNIEGLDTEEVRSQGALLGTIKKVKTGSRRQALDMLMKHLGGYEQDNSQKQAVVVLVGNEDPLADEPKANNGIQEDSQTSG